MRRGKLVFPRPTKPGLLFAAGVCTTAALVYYFTRGPEPTRRSQAAEGAAGRAPAKGGDEGYQWYTRNLPFWSADGWVSLQDRSALSALLGRWMEQSTDGTSAYANSLKDALTCFFSAWCASTVDEYLSRLGGSRALRADMADDRSVQGFFHYYQGRYITSSDLSPQIAKELWAADGDIENRPVSIAVRRYLGFRRSLPIPSDFDPRTRSLRAATYPSFGDPRDPSLDSWFGPFSGGMPRITNPSLEYSDALRGQGTVDLAMLQCALRTKSGEIVPLGISLFRDAHRDEWHVLVIGDYYPYVLCWPY